MHTSKGSGAKASRAFFIGYKLLFRNLKSKKILGGQKNESIEMFAGIFTGVKYVTCLCW
jgi:hypothetical protein